MTDCQHEYVLHMIQMPEGYSKPGGSFCKHCGEPENRVTQQISVTHSCSCPPSAHAQFDALAPSVFLGPGICTWREDEDGNWDTACGDKWVLNDGTPSENHMNFCPMCGRNLVELRITTNTAVA